MCYEFSKLHVWQIPMPRFPKPYLALGWYRIVELDHECLKWSFARGTPQFPGGDEEIAYHNRRRAALRAAQQK